jgi:LmeA-like phospholipid-binding
MAAGQARKAGRARKVTVVLVVLAVLLGGLLVVADRVAAHAAERTVARQAAQQLAAQQITAPREPAVTVAGVPFLTQVLRGRYQKITIDVAEPTAQGVALDDLSIVATGINASTDALLNGSGRITADDVTGTVRLSWDSVTKFIDLSQYGGAGTTVSALPDGQVQIKAPVTVANVSATLVATGTIQVVGATAQVHINTVTAQGGSIPPIVQSVLGAITQQLSFQVKIPPLPYQLKVKSVQARPEGVTVTVAATDVPISSGGS